MAGTPEGAARAKQTMIAKYGSEEAWRAHLKRISSKGGSKKGVVKGFALMTPDERAEHGRRGGAISRRGSKKNVTTSN